MESVAQPTSKVRYPGYIRNKRYYTEHLPGTTILTLSVIQILMAITSITVQAFGQNSGGSSSNAGAGIWCGIVFGLSGIFGIIAWKNPSFSTILVYKIFNTLSLIFCLPLITMFFFFGMVLMYNAILLWNMRTQLSYMLGRFLDFCFFNLRIFFIVIISMTYNC